MSDVAAAVEAALPGVRAEIVESLHGGDRSVVERLALHDSAGSPRRVVAKLFHGTGESWVREAAALSVLRGTPYAAQVVVERPQPQLVVMDDLGDGPSVADALLGDDPARAERAVVGWATTVAGLHAATRDDGGAFTEALNARSGDLPVAPDPMPQLLAEAAVVLARHARELDVAVTDAATTELETVHRRLGGGSAISPADTCPDNNIERSTGMVLLDFEGASFRPTAWDVAYLTVPWPSCWCSWLLPDAVADAGLACFGTDRHATDVQTATVAWQLLSTSWLLVDALAGDPPPPSPHVLRPTRRAMVLHRLESAAGTAGAVHLPALARFSEALHAELERRWGPLRMERAPAFR